MRLIGFRCKGSDVFSREVLIDRLKYYSPCRIKHDKDITKEDIENNSLLLIGTPKTNLVFKKFAKQLPVNVTDNSVNIGKKTVNDDNLSFYAIFPNPCNSNNYIGIIGSNNLSTITIGVEDPEDDIFNDVANYGWYDYSIWKSSSLKIVSSGYFNLNWE